MNKDMYEIHPSFIYRKTVNHLSRFLELKELRDLSLDESLLYLKKDKRLLEALRVSSISLYNDILAEELHSFSVKRKTKIFEGVLKYYVRSCSRPTPFGLYANVGVGQISDRKSNSDNNALLRKEISPDMEWLMKFVSQLEEDILCISKVNVKFNNLAYIRGDRVILNHSNKLDKASLPISIKCSKLIRFVKEVANSYIYFEELAIKVAERFNFQINDVATYLFNLIQSDYIVTSLKPMLRDGNFLDHLITNLNFIGGYEELVEQLRRIRDKMSLYKFTELGDGIQLYEEIENEMKKVVDTPNVIKVDYINEEKEIITNYTVRNLPHSVYILELLEQKNTQKYLEDYKRLFTEKYGNRKVRLIDLLDGVIGIGFPVTYESSKLLNNINDDLQIRQQNRLKEGLLQQWLYYALTTEKKEIEINDEKIEQLEKLVNNESNGHPLSRELYFTCIKDNNQEKILLNSDTGSNFVGKSASRFLNYFKEEEYLNPFFDNKSKGYEFVGINLYTSNLRTNNILVGKSLFEYEINLEANTNSKDPQIIPIDDLLIGVEGNQFVIFSKILNKRVIPVANNMLNIMFAPEIYRFLVVIGEECIGTVSGNCWGNLRNSPYLPRIQYRNIILSPQTWNLSKDYYRSIKNAGLGLNEYIEELQISRYVYLQDENLPDNKILLDLELDFFLSLLGQRLESNRGSDYITLFESGVDYESTVSQPVKEYIVALKRKQLNISPQLNHSNNSLPILENNERIILPTEGNWMFFKLYIDISRQNDFIFGPLKKLNQVLLNEKLINKSYYIRYRDKENGFHIRYRVNYQSDNSIVAIMSYLNNTFRGSIMESFGTKYVIDTYEPEFERYLGKESFGDVENYFCMESNQIIEYLSGISFTKKEKLYFGVFSIIAILVSFKLSIREQKELLDHAVRPNQYSKEFRKVKEEILLYCNPLKGESLFYEKYPVLQKYFEQITYAIEMNLLPLKQKFDPPFLLSILHMYCNRLFGIDREFETKINCFARHLLKSLQFHSEQNSNEALLVEDLYANTKKG